MSAIVNGKGTVGIRGGAVVGAPIITQFITTWKTDNAGSATNTIIIPTTGSGYACTVDWGDGTTSTYSGTAPSITHTYSSIGTYTVKISGTFPRIYFNNAGDKLKLLTIEYWGNIAWTSMANAFYGCLNLKLNAPDVPNLSACSDTSYMFCNTKLSGNLNLSGWNTSNVTLMYAMFNGFTGSTSLNLSNWDVSKVTNLGSTQGTGMFGNSKLTDINVSNWTLNTTSNVTAHSMFYNCTVLTGVTGINTWNTSKITTMIYMFNACTLLPTLDLSNWNLSSCTNFNTMFQASGVKNLNLSNWILPTSSGSSVTMNQMFVSCASLSAITGLNTWNTSRVTDMYGMFASSPIQTLDLTGWNMSACTTTGSMFQNNLSLKSVNLTGWSNLSNVITASNMFYNCSTLSSITGTQNWNLSKVTTTSSMFSYCTQLRSLDLSGLILNTTSTLTLASMFNSCSALTGVTGINNWNPIKVTTVNSMFYNCISLQTINLSGWNLSACTNFGTGQFDGMLNRCTALTDINVSGWTLGTSTGTSITMGGIFGNNTNLSGITGLNTWNTSRVTSLSFAFDGTLASNKLNVIDLSGWNLSACTNFSYMFRYNTGIKNVNVSGWTLNTSTGASINMLSMFDSCPLSSTTGFNTWNTSRVISTNNMFNGCIPLKSLDLSNWNMSANTNTIEMFRSCTSLTGLTVSNWTLATSTGTSINMTGMFSNMGTVTPKIITGLNTWNITRVTNFTNFLATTTLDTTTYSNMLIAWDALDPVNSLSFNGGGSLCNPSGLTARQSLVTNDLWSIIDGNGTLTP